MEFKYDYIDESLLDSGDIDNFAILAEGPAKFLIKRILTTDRNGAPLTTREGLPKFKIMHTIIDCNGVKGTIWKDVSSKMLSTIRDLGESVGVKLYNQSGKFNPEVLEGCAGECHLKMNISKNPAYPDKINVDRYFKRETFKEDVDYSPLNELDDIPF